MDLTPLRYSAGFTPDFPIFSPRYAPRAPGPLNLRGWGQGFKWRHPAGARRGIRVVPLTFFVPVVARDTLMRNCSLSMNTDEGHLPYFILIA